VPGFAEKLSLAKNSLSLAKISLGLETKSFSLEKNSYNAIKIFDCPVKFISILKAMD